jgi:hypothetical protein
MKSVIEISESTGLAATDIDYISKSFIPPSSGGGKRGVKKTWVDKSFVEFAVTGRFLRYGITVKKVAEIFNWLRKVKAWDRLFTSGGKLNDIPALKDGGKVYLYMYDADPKQIGIVLYKKSHKFELKKDNRDMIVLDVTDDLLSVA